MIKNQSPSRQEQTTERALMYDEPLKAKVLQKSLAYYAQLDLYEFTEFRDSDQDSIRVWLFSETVHSLQLK